MMLTGTVMLLLYRLSVDSEEQRMRDQVFAAVLEGISMIYSTARSELAARGGPAPSAIALAGAFRTQLVKELKAARAKLHESWLTQYGPRIGSASLTATASVLEGIPSPFAVEWIAANYHVWVPSRKSKAAQPVDEETDDAARVPVLSAVPTPSAAAAAGSSSEASDEELVLVRLIQLMLGRVRGANKRRDRQVTSSEWLFLLQL
jgi:hypothetical protein